MPSLSLRIKVVWRRSAWFLLAAGLLTSPVWAQEQDLGKAPETPPGLSSLQKSLLIPGWGQIVEKRYFKGIAFLAAESLCLYQILRNNGRGNKAFESYKKAGSVADAIKQRSLTETYDRRRNIFMLAGSCVWALNLLDMVLIRRGRERGNADLKAVVGGPHGQEMALSFSVRF